MEAVSRGGLVVAAVNTRTSRRLPPYEKGRTKQDLSDQATKISESQSR